MARRSDSITVKVPASTSNLGSGFDTLGLALNLYNRITVRRLQTNDIALTLPDGDAGNSAAALRMITAAADGFFKMSGVRPFGFFASLAEDVPVARGVGFSATVRIGVIAALNALTNGGLDRQQLLELGTALEGHPDNASPALLGGFTVSGRIGETVRCLRFEVSRKLKIIALFPALQLRTDVARSVLPATYSKRDAVHNLNRSALIAAAFASGKYEALAGLFDDTIHQPYREKLLPQLSAVIRAGEKAGALGGFLSGAGSGIICLALRNAEAVAKAMQRALPDSETRILTTDNSGVKL